MDLMGSSQLALGHGAESSSTHNARRASDAGVKTGGFLVVNADDWGRDKQTTDRTLECFERGSVSSVSGMVFMEDSERAAALARQKGIETGLHLNFTTSFSASNCPTGLRQKQERVGRYLLWHRYAQILFHPGLMRSFEYLVAAQIDEFRRIYGSEPARFDGHHHMHLSANVILQRLLPRGTIVRRNFSFELGKTGLANRLYRKLSDFALSRRHRMTDFFFSLPPLEPASRLQRIYTLARQFVVELETHPVQPDEYHYLTSGEIFRQLGGARIAPFSALLGQPLAEGSHV